MGDLTGFGQAKVSRLETGKVAPLLQDLVDLSEFFKVPVARLHDVWKRAA